MNQYHAGEIKSPGLEWMFFLLQILAYLILGFAVAGACIVAGLPFVASGTIAGLIVVGLFIGHSFFETISYTCPGCNTQIKSVRNFGHYQCPVCGLENRILEDKIKK